MLIRDPVPFKDSDLNAWLEDLPDSHGISDLEADFHETKPAFERLLVDHLERVWLNVNPIGTSGCRYWLPVDSDSRVRGQLAVSVQFSLQVARAGRLYAVPAQMDWN